MTKDWNHSDDLWIMKLGLSIPDRHPTTVPIPISPAVSIPIPTSLGSGLGLRFPANRFRGRFGMETEKQQRKKKSNFLCLSLTQ